MKKAITIILSIMLIMAITFPSAAVSPKAVSSKITLKPVKLVWYMPPPSSDLSNKDSVLAAVNKMLVSKINATLEINFIDFANYPTKINTMLAAGEPFDLFTSIGYLSFASTVAKKAVVPIDDLLAKYGSNIIKLTDKKYWSAVTSGGKKMAIINVMPFTTPNGATYQKALVDKYKFDVNSVKTLKDLEPFLAEVKKGEPGITPLYTLRCLQQDFISKYDRMWTNSNYNTCPIVYDTTTKQLKYVYDCKDYVDRLTLLNSWYKKGYIAKDEPMKKDYTAEIKSKKYAVWGSVGATTDDGVKSSTQFGFPCVDTTQGLGMITTGTVQTALDYISKTSKNPERAMMLMNTLFGDKKIFNTLCYGVEGQDYAVVSGAGTDNPTVKTKDPMKWIIWHPWVGEMNVNQWPSNLNDAKALSQFIQYNKSAKTSDILGFVFDSEAVKTDFAKVDALYADYTTVESAGSFNDVNSYIKDMKDKLNKAGITKVMAECQKQLAKWRADNRK